MIEEPVHPIPADFWFGHFPKAAQSQMKKVKTEVQVSHIEKDHTLTLTHLDVG